MERTTTGISDKLQDMAPTSQPREGKLTKAVENYTAQVPSIAYLGLALGSMLLSAGIAGFTTRKTVANFVGLWVPTIMLVGVYNKLVKLEGNDRFSREAMH